MVFTSFEFLVFFPLVLGMYFLFPVRTRWIQLLLASYYFYMAWRPVYALLLLASTVSFYVAALGVDRPIREARRKAIFFAAVAGNLAMLFAFKYFNFFEGQFNTLADRLGLGLKIPVLDVLLPMGISFYTFQGISYLVDVYRRDMPAERHIGLLMLYKAFFPQLVAGPIERGTHFLPQLRHHLLEGAGTATIRFEYDRVVSGLRLMLLGFFKKIVLADNFALIVQPVYAAPDDYSGPSAIVATLAFALQIFFDFSAYTDIARGISRVLGFELIENFKRPYFARNIADFWQRWHISLSSWFRDYLYIPLGGNRVARWRWFMNLWIVFLLCGLWHGANWTFLIWGALHGFYYFLFYLLSPLARWVADRSRLSRLPGVCGAIQIVFTFCLVCWAWVMFRAENLDQALAVWGSIARTPAALVETVRLTVVDHVPVLPLQALGLEWLFTSAGRQTLMPVYVTVLTLLYLAISHRVRDEDDGPAFARWGKGVRWASYFFALSAILLLGRFGAAPFIYFQF
ncbi:MAG: MBOAT family O-acyltransferase [Burkholderiales bacterium]